MIMTTMKAKNKSDKSNFIISDGCCVQYGDTLALDNVTFKVNKGNKIAVVGPNGGGKSTLFNAMTGLVPLANGTLEINGLSPDRAKKDIGYIPQKNLINWNFPLSVKQVVEMGLTQRKTLNPFKWKNTSIIKDSIKQVGLIKEIDKNINELSGGQLQRVFIARTIAQGSDILLLDEAFSAVDVGAQEDLMKIINDIKLDGKTILIATHDINNIEDKFDEVICLNRHCCAYGDSAEVLTKEVMEEMYGSHNSLFKNHKPGSHGDSSGNWNFIRTI